MTTDTLSDSDSAAAGMDEIAFQRQKLPTVTPRPVLLHSDMDLAAVQAEADIEAAKPDIPDTENETGNDTLTKANLEMRETGAQFLNWLANGLADGSIAVNQSGAPVHFVEQGMLLVTPAIFRDYGGGVFNKTDPEATGPMAQKGFERLKLHQRTRRSAMYRAMTANGSRKILFHCYLIPEHNIRHIIQPASRPQNNTGIQLDDSDLLKMEQHS